MRSGRRGWMLGAAGAAVACLGLGATGAIASPTSSGPVVIASTSPLNGSDLAASAPAPAARTAEVHLFLGRDPAGLRALDEQVSDPSSSSSGQFLTPAQVASRFGATLDEIAGVDSWLRSQGLHVTDQSPYLVSAAGPAGSVATGFGTTLVASGAGQLTNATPMSMPSSLAGQVLTVTVTGTKPVPDKPKLQAAPRQTAGQECSQYYGQLPATGVPPAYGEQLSWAPCGYTPNQVRSALFAKASGLTGQGVTVAIISGDNDSTAFADANAQASQDGFAPLPSSQFVSYVEKGSRNGVGDVESAIDVEAVHATAPGATIAYVAGGKGETDDPTLNALEQIVGQHLADVVTDSWGLSENFTLAIETAFSNALQRAGVEGITVDTASGDVGSNPPLSYLFPASDPWLTTVGGTSLAIGSNGQYLWQTGWEDGSSKLHNGSWNPNPPGKFDSGSTGGVSTLFPEPYYQQGVVSGNVVGGTAMEVYPDVSDLADPDTGYSVAYTVSRKQGLVFETWGGTSLASPLFAGIEADVIQGRHDAALGYANPTLYGYYGSQAFNDVTDTPQGAGVTEAVAFPAFTGSKIILGTLGQAQLTGLSAGPGFDDVTGLGTPSAQFYSLLER
jgi:subtilase family serine protease